MDRCPVCGEEMYEVVGCVVLEMEVCPDCCQEACEEEWLREMERKNYDIP
jgi:hypothetical protein